MPRGVPKISRAAQEMAHVDVPIDLDTSPSTEDTFVSSAPTPAETAAAETVAATVPAGFAPTMDQWAQLIDALRTNKNADMEVAATLHALAMKKALRPENEQSPMISVFNPKGERDFPRPKPKCEFKLGPFPICDPGDYSSSTWTEIELLNQLVPGVFPVTKSDGSTVKLVVKPEYDTSGTKLTQMVLLMPIADDEQKNNYPPLLQILSEVVTGDSAAHNFAQMQARIRELETKLAASAA